jgi:3-hydroxyisobutyrate dehydrogenase-like beta-hydroxyacid dehydrogenase
MEAVAVEEVDARVGVLGLGQMGSRMALRVLDAGYQLLGHDRSATAMEQMEKQGVSCVGTPEELGSRVDVVLASLPDGAASLEVLRDPDGLLAHPSFSTYVEMSTVGPIAAGEIRALLDASGIAMLDGPVSGGTQGAASGTLTMMLAGDPEVASQWGPLFAHLARRVVHLGVTPGQGQAMKVINNLLEATALCVTAEGMAVGVKAGLDPRLMAEVLSASSGRNSATEVLFPDSVLTGTFDEGFALGLAHKDLRLCLEYAEREGCPMWIGSTVRQWMAHALTAHGSSADFTTVVKEIESWAGVEIRAQRQADSGAAALT